MNHDFVALEQAATEQHVSTSTLRRRVQRLGLPVFADPRDQRRRLLRREDVETAFGPPTPLPGSSTNQATGLPSTDGSGRLLTS